MQKNMLESIIYYSKGSNYNTIWHKQLFANFYIYLLLFSNINFYYHYQIVLKYKKIYVEYIYTKDNLVIIICKLYILVTL